MHTRHHAWIARSIGGVLLLALGAVGGCMASDGGLTDMQSGTGKVASGLTRMRGGLDSFKSGDQVGGLGEMRAGMALCKDGDGMMRSGLMGMSDEMAAGCGSSHESMMKSLDDGMRGLGQAMTMMGDDDPSNDAAGTDMMAAGITDMESRMKRMDTMMSCMGHQGMM